MFDDLHSELVRLNSTDVQLESDERNPSGSNAHVKVTIGDRSCCVQIAGFLEMLHSLPDGAGEQAIEAAIESEANHAEGWATC